MILLVLFRLRLTASTFELTEILFGRSEEYIQTFTTLGFEIIYTKFRHLLNILHVRRIFGQSCIEIWKHANLKKYRKLSHENFETLPREPADVAA